MDNATFHSCLEKQERLKTLFAHCSSAEGKYQKIIELGRELPIFPEALKKEENIVKGCQSTLYLHTSFSDGKIIFETHSEALISAGLSALLVAVYSGEAPETILKCPPSFLSELGIQASLTPGRSNGLASMYLKMKQEALKFLLLSAKN